MERRNFREPSFPAATPLPTIGLLIELGRQRRKEIGRLKRGDGPLTRQIEAAVASSCEKLGYSTEAEVVPVVLLYRQTENYVVIAATAGA